MKSSIVFDRLPAKNSTSNQVLYWKKYRLSMNTLMLEVRNNEDEIIKHILCFDYKIQQDYLYVQSSNNTISVFMNDIENVHTFSFTNIGDVRRIHGLFYIDGMYLFAVALATGLTAYKAGIRACGDITNDSLEEIPLPSIIRELSEYYVTNLGIIEIDNTARRYMNNIHLHRWENIFYPYFYTETAIPFRDDVYVSCFSSNIVVCANEDIVVGYNIDDHKRIWSMKVDKIMSVTDAFICCEHQIIDTITGKTVYSTNNRSRIDGMTAKDDGTGYIVWEKIFKRRNWSNDKDTLRSNLGRAFSWIKGD